MRERLKRIWPILKALLAVAILAAVGWQFVRILSNEELRQADPSQSPAQILWVHIQRARPEWLALSAILYILGLGFSAFFWLRLLRVLGQRPVAPAIIRAYYISHLGKYVPGKAWALLLRTTLASGPGVRPGVAALTATYETLTLMASGALIAAVLLTFLVGNDGTTVWRAVGLLALAGIPILPGVFNRLVRRLSAPFLEPDTPPLPSLRMSTLLGGLALTGCAWSLLGMSLWAVTEGVWPEPGPWLWATWLRYTAYVALAYVAGFLALPAPGGLGVREYVLLSFLAPVGSAPELRAVTVVVVLLLRLLWTAAEVVTAGIVYWLPGQDSHWATGPGETSAAGCDGK